MMISMFDDADYVTVAREEQRCDICDCRIPVGAFVAYRDDLKHCCAGCLAVTLPVDYKDGGKLSRGNALELIEEMEHDAADKRSEADDLLSEARQLERRAEELRGQLKTSESRIRKAA